MITDASCGLVELGAEAQDRNTELWAFGSQERGAGIEGVTQVLTLSYRTEERARSWME